MKLLLFLTLYNILYPVFLVLSLPGYLIKMYRRGGYGTGLLERFGYYKVKAEEEPTGGIYVHAVSVGEVLIAVKWIREWLKRHPEGKVVLATSTSTGHEIAIKNCPKGVRVLYSPLDLPMLAGRCLNRFRPRAFVLVEAELWPNMGMAAKRRGIPQIMINARLSARSERRYKKILPLTRLFFSFLDKVCVQDKGDVVRFAGIGIPEEKIVVTGSIKFDHKGISAPGKREDYSLILDTLRRGKPVVLAASTHAEEEVAIAAAIRGAGGFPLIIPRHAERRDEVVKGLNEDGWEPVLRTKGILPDPVPENACYVADTTGELRDWTAHAEIVVIGKSFLSKGGQNPAEAIAAKIPVIAGPHMGNFQSLADLLDKRGGIYRAALPELEEALVKLLGHPEEALTQAENAFKVLSIHDGAAERTAVQVEQISRGR